MKTEKIIQDETNSTSPSGVGGFSTSPSGVGGTMFYGALPIHFELAKKLRENQTDAEMFLWEHLPIIQVKGVRFKRQHPVLYFIADLYCHRAKLIIEIDGAYHNIPEQHLYDANRDNELTELGLKVLRFTNDEIFNDIENTLIIIKNEVLNRINSEY